MTTRPTRKVVINTSYGDFCLSHVAFRYLRALGQREALQEEDLGAYWPAAARPNEPSPNRFGERVPVDPSARPCCPPAPRSGRAPG